ncbi:hypothetical protein ACLOJK_018461 [Asimina triloba]
MNEGRKVGKLRSSACVEDTGKQIQVCDQQRLTENMLQMTVEHVAEDETIPMNEEGREVTKLQSSACGEDNGVYDQQRSTEEKLQMTVKHATEDLTIEKSVDGRKDEELESFAFGEDTIRHIAEDSSIQENEERREVEKLQSFACGEDTGKQTRYCDQQRLTESMLRMKIKRAAEESSIQKNEEGRKVWKLRSSACAEDISKQTQVCDQQRSTEDMLQMFFKHAAEDLSIQKSKEGRKRKSETSAWGKDADLTIQESEKGREITELQSSACEKDTEKRTQTCDQQRLTKNMLQMNVAAVQHTIDLKPTDDIVPLEKDFQSEQITNTFKESGSASDFQSAGGKHEKFITKSVLSVIVITKSMLSVSELVIFRKIHSKFIKAWTYLMQQDGKTRTKNNNENVSELHPKINDVSNGHCLHFSHLEKLKLREKEDYFSVLGPLGGSQDSRKAIQEDERVRSSANGHIIGDKVQHELWTERDNLYEEQASSALDSSSYNQESAHDGRRCMDASLSSTNFVEVTEGGSNFDGQKDLLPDIPVE